MRRLREHTSTPAVKRVTGPPARLHDGCGAAYGRSMSTTVAAPSSHEIAKVEKSTNPDRGALLIVSGERDHTVPWAIANASYNKHTTGVTEIVEVPDRGHALTIDGGWREVAETALAFVRRFV